jgi:hypothetical protein
MGVHYDWNVEVIA